MNLNLRKLVITLGKTQEIIGRQLKPVRRLQARIGVLENCHRINDHGVSQNSETAFGKPSFEACGIGMVFVEKLIERVSQDYPADIELANDLKKKLGQLLKYQRHFPVFETQASLATQDNIFGLKLVNLFIPFDNIIKHISASLAEGLDGKVRYFRSVFDIIKTIFILKGNSEETAFNQAWLVVTKTYSGTTGSSPFYNHSIITDLEMDLKIYQATQALPTK